MSNVNKIANGGFFLVNGGGNGALVQINNYPFKAPSPTAYTRIEGDADLKAMTDKKIRPWGSNNLKPKEIKTDINTSSLLKRGLKVRIDAHYGKGIKLFKEIIQDGKHIYQAVQDPEVQTFFNNSQINKFQYSIIADFETFRNYFVGIVLDPTNLNKIIRIYRIPAMFCRWKEIEADGKIKKLYVHDWYNKPTDISKAQTYDVLDIDNPINDLQNRIKTKKNIYKYILPIKTEEFDEIYYDQTFWDPIRKTWLPIATAIPEIKAAIMKNQMVLKYHVKIPYQWLQIKWAEQQITDPKKKEEYVNTLMDDINKYLTDIDNYGKSFVSFYGHDPMNTSKDLGEWKFEVLDNKLKEHDHLPDSKAANQEILAALGIDAALLGGTLPGGSEAGSGSNKREAYLILQSLLAADRDYTTAWFPFVRDYNKWDPYYTIQNIYHETQTLDKNPTGIKQVV